MHSNILFATGIYHLDEMNLRYVCVLVVLLMVECLHARSLLESQEDSSVTANDQAEETAVNRVKRAPLGKLALLGGAALLGKKALVLGGAAVGAKALVGAGLLGAGLYKAKHYGGGYGGGFSGGYGGGYGSAYGGGYAHYDHQPSNIYVESAWWD